MKRIIFSIVALMAVLTMQAQAVSHKLEWDAHVGFGDAMIYDADNDDMYDPGASINLGVGVGYPITKVWSVRSGLDFYYSKPNLDYDVEYFTIEAEVKQLRVELPVMAGARLHVVENVDVLLEAGAYFSCGLGGKTNVSFFGESEETDTYGDDSFMRFDSGLALGANLEIRHFMMGLNLRTGWAKAMDGMKLYNCYGNMTFGYKF